MIIKEEKVKKKRFRIRSKNIFLTYSGLTLFPHNISNEELMINLKNLEKEIINQYCSSFNKDLINKNMKHIIAYEQHQDNTETEKDHLHIVLSFPSPIHINDRQLFDLNLPSYINENTKLYFGNYQAVRSLKNTIRYICKDNNYVTNMNMFEVNNKVYFDIKEYSYALIDLYSRNKTWDETYEKIKRFNEDSIWPIKNYLSLEKLFNRLQKYYHKKQVKINFLESIYPIDTFRVSDSFIKNIVPALKDLLSKYSLIVYGEAGSGKTEFSKSLGKFLGKEISLIKRLDQLKDENLNNITCLLFDDLDTSLPNDDNFNTILNLTDISNYSSVNVKFDQVPIPTSVSRIFTCNQLEKFCLENMAIRRRIILLEYIRINENESSYSLFNPSHPPMKYINNYHPNPINFNITINNNINQTFNTEIKQEDIDKINKINKDLLYNISRISYKFKNQYCENPDIILRVPTQEPSDS